MWSAFLGCRFTILPGYRTRFNAVQPCLRPFVMFNVEEGRQEGGKHGGSFQNREEAKLLITMLNYMYGEYKPEDVGVVAIISPYRAQVCCTVPVWRQCFRCSMLCSDTVGVADPISSLVLQHEILHMYPAACSMLLCASTAQQKVNRLYRPATVQYCHSSNPATALQIRFWDHDSSALELASVYICIGRLSPL